MPPMSGTRIPRRDIHDEGTVSPESDNSAPLLGEEAQTLISCNQKLQELGIGSTIKLPQICVVGDQSTGKSSLIEAISTIRVPKAKGLCTQCPVAINLSSGSHPSAPWTCTVYIEQNYTFDEAFMSKGVSKNDPFGPWQERPHMEKILVKTTNDKEEVCDLIRAAQATILNPGTDHRDHVASGARRSTSYTTKFSPNVIRLDVSEGSWPNLSFVDLPGVITNTGGEKDRYLVKLIENLVTKYATAERSVNMLTLPMTHDTENSKGCAMIQKLKLEDRTLAVFTKADLADVDQRAQYLNKFLGREDDLEFKHGYHFVVMPDDVDQEEAHHVLESVPLRTYLRQLLFEKTREALPGNLEAIEERLAKVNDQLRSLPEPPNVALLPLQLQQSVTQFESAMKMLFSGDASGKISARTAWTQIATKFKKAITEARPTLFLESRGELARWKESQDVIKSFRSQNDRPDAVMVSSDDEDIPTPHVKTENTSARQVSAVHRFRFEEIRSINSRYYQANIPGEIELRAIEEMNRLSVSHWDTLLSAFMEKCHELLTQQINDVMQRAFGAYKHLELFSVIDDKITGFLEATLKHERDTANEVCQLEQEKPLTFHLATIQEKESECLADRLQKRRARRIEIAKAELDASEGMVKKRKECDLRIPEPDPFTTELTMSAKSRAYYEVAGPRFVDTICLGVFGRLLPKCTDGLVNELKDHLGLTDFDKHDQIVKWMAEDPEREERRARLLREHTKLTEGMRFIKDVLGSDNSPSKRRRSASLDLARRVRTPSKRLRITNAQSRLREDEEEGADTVSPSPRRNLSASFRSVGLHD